MKKNKLFNSLKIVLNYALKYDIKYFFILFFSAIANGLLPIILIVFPKLLLDIITTTKDTNQIFNLIIIFFLISGSLKAIGTYCSSLVQAHTLKIRSQATYDVFYTILNMDYVRTEDPESLNQASIATDTVGGSVTGFEGTLRNIITFAIKLVTLISFVLVIGMLNIYILIFMLLSVLISYYLSINAKKYEYSLKDEKAEITRHSDYLYKTMYDFSYGKDIRIYNMSTWLSNTYKTFQYQLLNLDKKIAYRNLFVSLIDVLLLVFREGVVYAYLIYRVINTNMGIGDFTMYFAISSQFASILQELITTMAELKTNSLYLSDLQNFIALVNNNDQGLKTLPEQPYEIEFKDVSFKYPTLQDNFSTNKYIFENLNLKIKAGEKLAIVGVNGAGKTTLVKLLTRLYEPTSGAIYINGINVKEFNIHEYFKIFSVVFQEVKTLAFTLAENIASSNNYDEEKVIEVIKKADLENKVLELGKEPGVLEESKILYKGINTPISKHLEEDGIELSGGQNQKISIARALYKDGGIMILDEPTAALDAIAEYNTYVNFDKMVGNKTAIYISHRLASTRFCDTIAVFENGKIIEYGTHESLLKQNGEYTKMFEVQARYYTNEQETSLTEGI